tara:strand:+ start:642 stop:989 length:348 start_codon:yes stop_codon:yes gene_type:complete
MTTPEYASRALFNRLPEYLRGDLAKSINAEHLCEESCRVHRVLELHSVEHTTVRDGEEVDADDEADAFWSKFVLTLEYKSLLTGETWVTTERWILEPLNHSVLDVEPCDYPRNRN